MQPFKFKVGSEAPSKDLDTLLSGMKLELKDKLEECYLSPIIDTDNLSFTNSWTL